HRAGAGAGQALPGQRLHPDARSAAFGLLRLASPGGDAHSKIEDCMNELVKLYPFKNYYETMAFVNALAWISHREDHHPDLQVGYNKCRVEYSTHAIGGLSENDFICAAKADALFTL